MINAAIYRLGGMPLRNRTWNEIHYAPAGSGTVHTVGDCRPVFLLVAHPYPLEDGITEIRHKR